MEFDGPGRFREDLAALRRYARSLTRNDATADDVVQEALLRAWQRRADLRASGAWRGWLLTIVRNVFVSSHRQTRARSRLDTDFADLLLAQQDPDQEHAVWLRQVAQSFAALPDPQREVLHLIAVEGLTYQEAALCIGVPVGTVMSRLSRAREAMRQAHDPAAPLKVVGGRDVS
jgi:RNA polymerase sigma factor (sigma-70 family)